MWRTAQRCASINKHRLQAAAQPVIIPLLRLCPSCSTLSSVGTSRSRFSPFETHPGTATGRSGQACSEHSKQFNDCLASIPSRIALRPSSFILDVLLSCTRTHWERCLRSVYIARSRGRQHHGRGDGSVRVCAAHPAAGRAAGPAGCRKSQEARGGPDSGPQRTASAQSRWVHVSFRVASRAPLMFCSKQNERAPSRPTNRQRRSRCTALPCTRRSRCSNRPPAPPRPP